MAYGMAAMMAHLIATVGILLGMGVMVSDHGRQGLTCKVMRHFVSHIERPALYVCRENKHYQQCDLSDEAIHGRQSIPEIQFSAIPINES